MPTERAATAPDNPPERTAVRPNGPIPPDSPAPPGSPAVPADPAAEDAASGELMRLLGDVVTRYLSAYEHAAAEQSLTVAQARVLALLTEGPLPMRQLAGRMACEPSNITGIIDRLELRGLVERHPDPNDRRVKHAAATAAGSETTRRLRRSLNTVHFAREPLAGLSPVERVLLRDLLKRLIGDETAFTPPASSAAPTAVTTAATDITAPDGPYVTCVTGVMGAPGAHPGAAGDSTGGDTAGVTGAGDARGAA